MANGSARARGLLIVTFVGASAIAHVLSLRFLPRPALVAPRPAVDVEPISMTITHDAQHAPVQRAEQVETRESAPHQLAAASAARDARVSRAVREPPSDEPPESAAPVDTERAAATDDGVRPAPRPDFDMSARGAALSALPLRVATAERPETRDELAVRRGAELSADLNAVANANPVRDHRALELERDLDGTCHYRGSAIDATILVDGSVRFEDKAVDVRAVSVQPLARGELLQRGGVQVPPERPVTPAEMVPAQELLFEARVAARGWEAERKWFLRETEGVRRELADAAHQHELAHADHELRKHLDRIWCDAAVPPSLRRRALFQLWDEMSADEVGARGRRVLLDYVRENLPKGSVLAYPPEQLAALNGARRHREPFDPYPGGRGGDADRRELR